VAIRRGIILLSQEEQAKASVSDESPHALVRYADGTVAYVCIEDSYGLQSYIQILETDCEHLSRLIDFHRLPPLAFERAALPGPFWELESTERELPQVGLLDWRSRYASTDASGIPAVPVLDWAAKKVLRRLQGWGVKIVPSRYLSLASGSAPKGLPGMRVEMQSSYDLSLVDASDSPAAPPTSELPSTAGCSEGVLALREWPRISVVTVSYNQCRFLRDCLDSVLGQNYPNLDFVVIDGGSTDGSREILESYRHRLSHLVIEPDRGQSHALNKGFRLATGDVLTWLCSDDKLEPGALDAVALVRSSQPCDIIVGGCRVIDDSGKTKLIHYSGFHRGCLSPLSFGDLASFTSTWQKGLYFYQPELFFTRDLWNRAGGHVKEHLHYVMDYELFLRFALSGARLYAVDKVLACSRQHEEQKTRHEIPMYLPTVRRVLLDFRLQLLSLVRP
jgi:GT2 family glycosyltransferase